MIWVKLNREMERSESNRTMENIDQYSTPSVYFVIKTKYVKNLHES